MKTSWLLFCAVSVGCASSDPVPTSESVPRVCSLRAPLPAGMLEVREYPYPNLTPTRAKGIVRTLQASFPEDGWKQALAGVEYYGDRFAIGQTPAGHERAAEVLDAIRHSGLRRLGIVARVVEVPWERLSSLGGLQQARGAGADSPFVTATPTSAWTDSVLAENEPLFEAQILGVAGEWGRAREATKQAYVAGIELNDRGAVPVGNPNVALIGASTSMEATCAPHEQGWLLAFEVVDEQLSWAPPLEARYGSFTRFALGLPALVRRRCADAVCLETEQTLAVIGATNRPGWARVILLKPQASNSWTRWDEGHRGLREPLPGNPAPRLRR